MKKLTKAQCAKKSELVERIDRLVGELNSAIEEAEELRDEVHSALEEYFDNRSEKWQEGDTGTAYREWMDEWDNEFETVDCDVSPDLDGMNTEFEP